MPPGPAPSGRTAEAGHFGDGVDGGPDEGALFVTADIGDHLHLVQLEKRAAQAPKEQIVHCGCVIAATREPAATVRWS